MSTILKSLDFAMLLLATPAVASAPAKPTVAETAESTLLKPGDVAGFVAALQNAGYKAKVERRDDGSFWISSAANGVFISLNFQDCELATGCDHMRLTSWWEKPKGVDVAAMNKWNNEWRLLRAVYDEEKDVVIDYYWKLSGGVTRENFISMFEWYASVANDFLGVLNDLEDAVAKREAPAKN